MAENVQKTPKKRGTSIRPAKRWTRRIALAILAVIALAAAGYAMFLRGGSADVEDEASYVVRRRDLRISVTEKGNLRAKNSVDIRSEVQGQATIVFLIPEGTFVKKGDILIKLDSSDLEERLTQQEITYNNAMAALKAAEENYQIQVSDNEAKIKKARLDLQFAEEDLKKYQEGDWPQQLREAQAKVTLAEEKLKRAKDRLEWTQKLYDKGYVTRSDLEADKLSVKEAEISLESAKESLKLLQDYQYKRQLLQLQSNYDQAQHELDRTIRTCAANLAKSEADLKSKRAQFELQEKRLRKVQKQLEMCTIRAPQDGFVVYNVQGRRFNSQPIEQGAKVFYRQVLLKLPDVSVMEVETKVHESEIDRVKEGQRAIVRIDALPNQVFYGHVTKINLMPDSQNRWLNPDLNVYTTTIELEGDVQNLRPGMSAQVEIIVADLNDVICVPIQCVSMRKGHEVCFVKTAKGVEIRPVEVGMSNDSFVEIRSGLKEGERVLLYPPVVPTEQEGSQLVQTSEDEATEAPGETSGTKNKPSAGTSEPKSAGGPEAAGAKPERASTGKTPPPAAKKGATISTAEREKLRKMKPEERRAYFMKKMMEMVPPEQRDKLKKMTPEEQKAFFQKMMRRRAGGGRGMPGGRPAPGAAPRGGPR